MPDSNYVKPPQLAVTEHALFRYCQRVLGADTKWLKSEIVRQILPVGVVLPDGKYPVGDGSCVAVVENNTVLTILAVPDLKAGVPSLKSKRGRRLAGRIY